MLKISIADNARRRRVIVEGKLIAAWAAKLRNAWQQASADFVTANSYRDETKVQHGNHSR
jgi:hypothetical protein